LDLRAGTDNSEALFKPGAYDLEMYV
jgi:hypothetical protein